MDDDEREIEAARQRVRVAIVAYQEGLDAGSDVDRMKELKADLYDAEAALIRLKRASESAPPSHLLE